MRGKFFGPFRKQTNWMRRNELLYPPLCWLRVPSCAYLQGCAIDAFKAVGVTLMVERVLRVNLLFFVSMPCADNLVESLSLAPTAVCGLPLSRFHVPSQALSKSPSMRKNRRAAVNVPDA